jgi:hypothetical protein
MLQSIHVVRHKGTGEGVDAQIAQKQILSIMPLIKLNAGAPL